MRKKTGRKREGSFLIIKKKYGGTVDPDRRVKGKNCPLHGTSCKAQPARVFAMSHAGIVAKPGSSPMRIIEV